MNVTKITITAGVAATLALGLGACSTGSVTKAATPASSAKPAAHHKATQKATPNTGPVGTTFVVTGTDDNGKPMSYKVTLVHFHQLAQPDNSFDAAPAGKHLASAEFKITGVKGNAEDDANNDAQATGVNHQVYQSAIAGLAAGSNFNSGDFQVAAGQTQVGFVPFEIPDSGHVASVQWSADGFMGGAAPGTWIVRH